MTSFQPFDYNDGTSDKFKRAVVQQRPTEADLHRIAYGDQENPKAIPMYAGVTDDDLDTVRVSEIMATAARQVPKQRPIVTSQPAQQGVMAWVASSLGIGAKAAHPA